MKAIGMFDSGIGGLSVLEHTRRLLPNNRLIYVADQAFAPYGDKSLEEVRRRSDRIATALIDHGADMIVIACHTASAAALQWIRERHPLMPVVGIEPAVKPAAERTETRTVGVMATTATFQGELFASVVSRFATNTSVIARPCPGLADLVEAGADRDVLRKALIGHLQPFKARAVDQIVLGCTHYSFLGDLIAEMSGIDVIDPAPAVAAQVARVARENDLEGDGNGKLRLLTTGNPEVYQSRLAPLLSDAPKVEKLEMPAI